MEYKIYEAQQVKLSDDGPGTISLYFSTFANWDRVRPIPERPTKGAFAPHLPGLVKDGWITISHDWMRLGIATITDAREDDYGGWLDAEFHTTADAQAARTVVKERLARGKSVKTSMGYEVLGDDYVEMDDPALVAAGISRGRLLTDVRVLEVSLVNMPANPLADVRGVKDLVLADMPLDAQGDLVRATIAAYATRVQGLQELRAKEGRTVSAATAARLRAIRDAIADLHKTLPGVAKEIDALLSLADPDRDKAAAAWRQVRLMTQRHVTTAHTLRSPQ